MAEAKKKETPICPECGRLFQPKPGMATCRQCAPKASDEEPKHERFGFIRRLAERLGFTPESILFAVDDSLPDLVVQEPEVFTCTQCQEKPAMDGSHLCFQCRVDSYHLLGAAARDVQSHVVKPVPKFGRHVGPPVRDLLEDKRVTAPVTASKTPSIVQLRGNQE